MAIRQQHTRCKQACRSWADVGRGGQAGRASACYDRGGASFHAPKRKGGLRLGHVGRQGRQRGQVIDGRLHRRDVLEQDAGLGAVRDVAEEAGQICGGFVPAAGGAAEVALQRQGQCSGASLRSFVGTLPFDAGNFGAPGCRILASPDVCLLAPIDAQGNGVVTLPGPMSPAIAGLKLHGQTAAFSTANPLGVATSESIVMRFR